MTMSQTSQTRGGKRRKAGRKPLKLPRRQVIVRLNDEDWRLLKELMHPDTEYRGIIMKDLLENYYVTKDK